MTLHHTGFWFWGLEVGVWGLGSGGFGFGVWLVGYTYSLFINSLMNDIIFGNNQ